MKGKKWDLLAQKGLKWVSDRIHALEVPTGQRDRRFLPGFTEDWGGFKLKPNSKQSWKPLLCQSTKWVEWERAETEGPKPLSWSSCKSTSWSTWTLHDPPKASRSQAGSGWHYTLQSLLHKTLYKTHPKEPAGRGGEVGNDQRRKERAPACAGILTPKKKNSLEREPEERDSQLEQKQERSLNLN